MNRLYPPYNRALMGVVGAVLLSLLGVALLQQHLPALPVLAVGFTALHLAAGWVQQTQGLRKQGPRNTFLIYVVGQASLGADFVAAVFNQPPPAGYGVLVGFVSGAMLLLLLF